MFRRHSCPYEPSDKLRGRLRGIPSHDLPDWARQSVYEAGRGIDYYCKAPEDLDQLREAQRAAQTLLAVVEEILQRHPPQRRIV